MKPSGNDAPQTVREYGKKLFAFIRGKVRTEEDAEDILQDVWYQLYNTSETIEQTGAWLYRVAKNKIIDRYRRKKPEPLLASDFSDDDQDLGFEDILMADDADPETTYLKNLFWQQLQEGLNELPVEQREVFEQNVLEGKTFATLAREKGINMKTLISRKGYAVRHLRLKLQTLYDEFINF